MGHKFTRKADKSLKVFLAVGPRQMNWGGGGPYFPLGPDEVGGGASKGDRGAVEWRGADN